MAAPPPAPRGAPPAMSMTARGPTPGSRAGTPCRPSAPGRAGTPCRAPSPGSGAATPRAATPRMSQQGCLTAREPGVTGDSTLKAAGMGLLGPRVPRLKLGRHDPAPCVPSAGKALYPNQDSVVIPAVETPKGLSDQRLRHRQRTGPGEITVHWASKGMDIPQPSRGYGRRTAKGDDVKHVFKAGEKMGVAEHRNTVGEAIYDSTKKEPLGKTWIRGHVLPSCTQDTSFQGFGKEYPPRISAKEAIFPRDPVEETEHSLTLYKRTHNSHAAGEPFVRDYEWPKEVVADPRHRFGRVVAKDSNSCGVGVKSALTTDRPNLQSGPTTGVMDLNLASFKEVSGDHLGTSKNLLQNLHVTEDHTFGVSTAADDIGVGQLIRGFYSAEEQAPDQDLGRCTSRGRRNFLSWRPMGIPTVRNDILPPAKRSLANSTNYGDETDARGLIAPGKFQHKGVEDEDFFARRSPEELLEIVRRVSPEISHADFDDVFARAVELHEDGDTSSASVEALMIAFSDWTVAQQRPPNQVPILCSGPPLTVR